MNDKFAELAEAYIGQNKAHIEFRRKLVNEKIFVFNFMREGIKSFEEFHNEIEKTRKKAGKIFSHVIVTKGGSQTTFKCILVRNNEYQLVAKNYDEFESQVYAKVLADIHRIWVDYLIDIYSEIAECIPNITIRDGLAYKNNRIQAFKDIELSITSSKDIGGSTAQELNIRLNDLECKRNIIEHNNCIVNERFNKCNPLSKLKLGDRIVVNTEQAGDAFALIETLANDLNKRALGRFKTLQTALD